MSPEQVVFNLRTIRELLTKLAVSNPRTNRDTLIKTVETLDEAIRQLTELNRIALFRGRLLDEMRAGHKVQLTQLQKVADKYAADLAIAQAQLRGETF